MTMPIRYKFMINIIIKPQNKFRDKVAIYGSRCTLVTYTGDPSPSKFFNSY